MQMRHQRRHGMLFHGRQRQHTLEILVDPFLEITVGFFTLLALQVLDHLLTEH